MSLKPENFRQLRSRTVEREQSKRIKLSNNKNIQLEKSHSETHLSKIETKNLKPLTKIESIVFQTDSRKSESSESDCSFQSNISLSNSETNMSNFDINRAIKIIPEYNG